MTTAIPAAPGWRAVYSDAQGLPDDEPLTLHIVCRPILAWEVRPDFDDDVHLRPIVASGGVVQADEPGLILGPGQEPEDFRRVLTNETRRARS
jgi:hypothetical protein